MLPSHGLGVLNVSRRLWAGFFPADISLGAQSNQVILEQIHPYRRNICASVDRGLAGIREVDAAIICQQNFARFNQDDFIGHGLRGDHWQAQKRLLTRAK